jgi:1-acyl-sn-glycerol-3-phosphate acyltransferase
MAIKDWLVFSSEPATVLPMSEFDDIRPYKDAEVAGVVSRLVQDDGFSRVATNVVMPHALHGSALGRLFTKLLLRWQTHGFSSIKQCQLLMADYLSRLVDATMEDLTMSGHEHLQIGHSYLFISNHRDIVLDSSLLNYMLHGEGHETSRIAVGDNLLSNQLAADVMRLNKSFVVERGATGARAMFNALHKTSAYTRASLEEGVSVWIAQRDGRAKDGYDRTDPALPKMLALAYRDEGGLAAMTKMSRIVPVSISYEVDPCAQFKAHELAVTAAQGHYEKHSGEDLTSMIEGVVGKKGRVHIEFHAPLEGSFDEPEELTQVLDRQIVDGLRIFPTHVEAAKQVVALGDDLGPIPQPDVAQSPSALRIMLDNLAACPEEEQPFFLSQYANLIKNRRDLGLRRA